MRLLTLSLLASLSLISSASSLDGQGEQGHHQLQERTTIPNDTPLISCPANQKMVYTADNQCKCKDTVPNGADKCSRPNTANTGYPICTPGNHGGCDVVCNAGMEFSNGDCRCKSGFINKGSYCEPAPTCSSQYERFDTTSNSCVCYEGCRRRSSVSSSGSSPNNNHCEPDCPADKEWRNNACRCKIGFAENNNGKCKIQCDGFKETPSNDGQSCECKSGFDRIDGRCIARCNAADNEQPSEDGTSCICKSGFEKKNGQCKIQCNGFKEIPSNDGKTCECKTGFDRINNRCIARCSANDNEEPSQDGTSCVCKSGFEKKGGQCKIICNGFKEQPSNDGKTCECKTGFNRIDGKCIIRCNTNDNEEPNSDGSSCICKSGFEKVGGQCKVECNGFKEIPSNDGKTCICKSGFDRINGRCTVRCNGANEVPCAEGTACVCKTGYEYFNGQCKVKCPAGQERNNLGVCQPKCPNPNTQWNGHDCVCIPGCSWNHGRTRCDPAQCRSNEIFNELKHRCVCKPGFKRTLWGFCVPDCPKPNEVWDGTKCVCKPGCHLNGNNECQPGASQRPQPGNNGGNNNNGYGQHHHWGWHHRRGQALPDWSPKLHTRDQDAIFCPDKLSACPIPSVQGGYECVDTAQELENCGGCAIDGDGVDCTTIPGVAGVGCTNGSCVIFSCTDDFRLTAGGQCLPRLVQNGSSHHKRS